MFQDGHGRHVGDLSTAQKQLEKCLQNANNVWQELSLKASISKQLGMA
jgi:hypothetical protein